jgi:hypothetical protein
MARRRVFVDKTEIVAGYVSGKKFVTQNITYDKITSIKVKTMKRPGLFGFGTCAAIEILLRGEVAPIIYYETQEKEFFEPYKRELEQFAKENRIIFADETK